MHRDNATPRPSGNHPIRLVGVATVATIVLGAIAISGAVRDPSKNPSTPNPVTASTATASAAALSPGVIAEVMRPFALVSDRQIPIGQRVFVVDGPTMHDGRLSYLLQHWGDLEHGLRPNSDFGWRGVNEAASSLRAVETDCPSGATTLDAISGLQPFERLVCFGGRQLAFGPVTGREYLVGASSPLWLSGDGSVDFPTAIPYVVSATVSSLDPNGWYMVEGHLDDPGCDRESEVVSRARCRQDFVLTSAVMSDPPAIFLGGTWRRIAESPLAGRTGPASAWTGREVLIWGGDAFDGTTSEYIPDGATYDPATDRWRRVPEAPIDGRVGAFAFWTGDAFLVWGGSERRGDEEAQALDGALFDPVADRWELVPPAPIDGSLAGTTASWTGTDLVVFSAGMRSGAAYDVASGRWRSIASLPFDAGETNVPALAWTGAELVVLGYPVDDVDTSMAWAAAWNPVKDEWRSLPDPGFRSMQGGPAVWTGHEVVVLWEANRAFEVATERWRTVDNACGASAGGVWTGRYAIEHGRAFDTATSTCRNLPLEPERPGGGYREFGVDIWTGSALVRWSGGNGGDGAARRNDGVAFEPDESLGP